MADNSGTFEDVKIQNPPGLDKDETEKAPPKEKAKVVPPSQSAQVNDFYAQNPTVSEKGSIVYAVSSDNQAKASEDT